MFIIGHGRGEPAPTTHLFFFRHPYPVG